MHPRWNPLKLLIVITRIATWLVGLGALAALIAGLSSLGVLPGTDSNPVCVNSSSGQLVCTDHPTASQRIADLGELLAPHAFTLIALLLAVRFLNAAAYKGPYAPVVPSRLSSTGWFLLAGGPAISLVEALSRMSLRSSLATTPPSADWFTEWTEAFPDGAVAAGLVALAFAHVLRMGVRADEKATPVV